MLLVASRVVQGAGAALVAPAALSLITTGFAEGPRAHPRARACTARRPRVGFVAGQVLGGVLVQFTSWRAVFLVNVPVGLARRRRSRPGCSAESRASQRPAHRLDVRGALLITAAVAALVFAVSQGDVLGWASPAVLGARRWPRPRPPPRSSPPSGTTPTRSSAPACCGCPGLRNGQHDEPAARPVERAAR